MRCCGFRRTHTTSPPEPAPQRSRLPAIQLLHTAVEDPDGFGPGFEVTGVRVDGPGVEGGFYLFGSVLKRVGKLTRWRWGPDDETVGLFPAELGA